MLCKALLRNTAVRVLVLSDCELGRDGARVLAEMLSRNASLNELVASSLATPCLMHSPTPVCTCWADRGCCLSPTRPAEDAASTDQGLATCLRIGSA